MNFGQKMKELREEKGKTQQEASEEMDIAISSLRNYEGGRFPDTVQLKAIKDYYGVPYEYLLDDDCENKSDHTLNIGKELKLTDNAISEIKRVNKCYDSMNLFIETIDLKLISEKIANYNDLKGIIENDLMTLIYICDLKKYILQCIKQNEQEKLIDYFKKCDMSIQNVINYTRKNTVFFNPSDSCYDLFLKNYEDLDEVIFNNENKKYNEKKEELEIALDNFLDLYEDVFNNMKIYEKYLKIELFEHLQKFYNTITDEEELLGKIRLDMRLNQKILEEPNKYKDLIKEKLYKKTFGKEEEQYKKILGKYLKYVDI